MERLDLRLELGPLEREEAEERGLLRLELGLERLVLEEEKVVLGTEREGVGFGDGGALLSGEGVEVGGREVGEMFEVGVVEGGKLGLH